VKSVENKQESGVREKTEEKKSKHPLQEKGFWSKKTLPQRLGLF